MSMVYGTVVTLPESFWANLVCAGKLFREHAYYTLTLVAFKLRSDVILQGLEAPLFSR